MSINSAGACFRQALREESPLQVMGDSQCLCGDDGKRCRLSCHLFVGAGVALTTYGLPDLGITSLEDVLIDVRRITAAVDTPLLVDIDTGWGGL